MNKVKMLRTINGHVNGIKMGPYLIGLEYDGASTPPLDEERTALFIEAGFAAKVLPPPPVKVAAPAPAPAPAPAVAQPVERALPKVGLAPPPIPLIKD